MIYINSLFSKKFRIYIVSSSWIIFILIFKPLFDVLGPGTAAIAALPVAITGISYGMKMGIVSSVGSLILTTNLLNISGAPGLDVIIRGGGAIGAIVIFLIGIGSGFIRDLEERRARSLRVETEQRNLEEYLDPILLNIPVGLAILEGPDNKYFRINNILAEINGLSMEEHLGRPLAEVLPDAAPDILPSISKVLKTAKPIPQREFSTRLPKDPQVERHFIDTFFPILGNEGKPVAVGVVVIDITERKELELRLSELIIVDPLTGIFNRRHFEDIAPIEFSRARRYKHALSVLMFDIDKFKKVNDTYGHHAGDEILKEVNGVVSEVLRDNDILFRVGGEEFAVLLIETELEHAGRVAHRMRKNIVNNVFSHDGGEPIRLTISVGVSEIHDSDTGFEEAWKRADRALYKAKENGRDRVEIE